LTKKQPSDGAFSLQNDPDGLKQNLDIIDKAAVIQIAAVQLDHLIKFGDLIAAAT
jgi:hypothetical protein